MKKTIQLIASLPFRSFGSEAHPSQGLKLEKRNGRSRTGRVASVLCLLAGVLVLFSPAASRAQSGTWTGQAGNWSATANWSGGIVADGTNNTANFSTVNVGGNPGRTVTVDTPRTISDILLGDTSGGQTWTFSGANVLTLANTTLKPQLRVLQNTTTFNVVLDGVYGMRKEQAAILVLNAANIYSGGTDINRGTLRLGHAGGIPSGPGKGDVTMNFVGGAPTLDIGSVNPTINGLNSTTDTATINSSAGAGTSTLSVGADDANGEFGGVIADGATRTVALTKIGTGTQSLTNFNTYSGATTISGGTLQLIGNGSISSSSSITLAGGATFDVVGVSAPPYLITSSQSLNGSGATGKIQGDLTLDSAAPVTLAYAAGAPTMNVASGTLTLNGNGITVNVAGSPLLDGSYKLISKSGSGAVAGSVGALTVGGVGIAGGGTPSLAITDGELFLNISGGATVVEWGSGNGTWAVGVGGWNSGGGTTFANGNVALFTDTFSTGDPTITLNTEVLPQGVIVSSTNHYTISGTGNIGGAADVRKLGTGALTLDVTNTYTGGSMLFDGTLNLKNASALGDAAGTFTINGGTLDNTSGSPLTLNNHPQVWNADFVFTGTADLDLGTGEVTLSGTRTVTVNAGTLTVGGVIAGTGGVVKAGVGTLELDGDNTFTGGVTINDGEVILNHDGALNSSTPNTVTFQTDTDVKGLSLNGHSVTIRNLAMGVIAGGGATLVRNNHASNAVTLTVDVASGSAQYAASIADGDAAPLAFTKTGAGSWTFGGGGVGAGTYSGDTTISAGTLIAGANNIMPSGAGKGNLIVNSGATFDILDRSAMSLNGLSGGGIVNRSNPGGSLNSTLTLGNADASGSFSGRIRTTGANAVLNLVKTGTGTQILSGANDYTGSTTINDGVLQIGDGGASGSLSSATIDNNSILVFNRDGSMTYSGVINGPGPVTNAGPGIVTLTGVNTYTGVTIVNAGTLRVNSPGSLAPESAVTVNDGGTLGGTGTIFGTVDVAAGGTLAPGAAIGTLSVFNTVNLQGTTVMEVSRDSGTAASDLLTGVSTLNYGGALLVTNIGITSLRSGDSFDMFDAATINPGFSSVSLPPLLPGLSWTTNLNTDGSISISGTVIPPQFSAPELSGTTLTFSGTGGVAEGTYYVLTSTDVTAPVENWTPFATNVFDAAGNFSFPDTADPEQPQRFYLIAIP